ncbi:NFACT family protein [Candidatus Micrarchaeota archaeon]|nr:NFACT family protein [Candidatus Micrarchaeota archaeon]
MQTMSNLDYYLLVSELQHLVGARLNKVYELSTGRFRLKFHKTIEFNLIVDLGKRMHLTKFIEESPKQPPSFVMLLRKYLENAILKRVEQLNFDRVVVFSFEKNGNYSLVFEMLEEGNVILCDCSYSIIQPYKKEDFSARRIRPREKYLPPPVSKKKPFELQENDLVELKGKLVPALSKTVSISPFYLEEACARAGLKFDADPTKLAESGKANLVQQIRALVNQKPAPTVYYEGSIPVAYSPFPLSKLSRLSARKALSFSEALDEYYRAKPLTAGKPKVMNYEDKLKKLEFSLAEQSNALALFEKQAIESRKKGDFIYGRYQLVEELLEKAMDLKKKKVSKEVIERELNAISSRGGLKVVVKENAFVLKTPENKE